MYSSVCNEHDFFHSVVLGQKCSSSSSSSSLTVGYCHHSLVDCDAESEPVNRDAASLVITKTCSPVIHHKRLMG